VALGVEQLQRVNLAFFDAERGRVVVQSDAVGER